MSNTLLNRFQRNAEIVKQRDVEVSESMKSCLRDSQSCEQLSHLAIADRRSYPKGFPLNGKQKLMPLCLLPYNLFPQQRNELWRQSNCSHCVVRLWCLFLAMPHGLINGEFVPVNIRQLQSCKFPGPQARLSRKPIKSSMVILRGRNDFADFLRVKNFGFFFGLRGSFGFGSIASTYFCARAAFQIRLTTPHMLRIVFGSSPRSSQR